MTIENDKLCFHCICTPYRCRVTINEGADHAVCEDIIAKLNEIVPRSSGYRHAEGNRDSRIKASMMGSSCL